MQEIFDFELMKNFFKKNPSFTVLMDPLNGGGGIDIWRLGISSDL